MADRSEGKSSSYKLDEYLLIGGRFFSPKLGCYAGGTKMQNAKKTDTTNTSRLPKTYVSVQSVAKRYEVSPNTIWRWTRDENVDFPQPVKLGLRSTRWKLCDLEAWEAK